MMVSVHRAAVVLLALLLSAPLSLSTARAQPHDSAPAIDYLQSFLDGWQEALKRLDHDAYHEHFHTAVLEVPEYVSSVAMKFWADELDELGGQGFKGQFCFEFDDQLCFEKAVPPDEYDDWVPTGAVRAYPIVGESPLDQAIVLTAGEAGTWKILRLFE